MKILKSFFIDSPLGRIFAISSDEYLYMLKFQTEQDLEQKKERLKLKMKAEIIEGFSKISEQVKDEVAGYFAGKIKTFTIPLFAIGTDFEKKAWQQLKNIPYGTTCSYKEQASFLGAPSAYRATANANGKNNISVIIPCHRVIQGNGNIGGYSSGSDIKEWLIEHERRVVN